MTQNNHTTQNVDHNHGTQEQQKTRQIIERICQQIQQQVQTFLNSLTIEAGQINTKNLQKQISSTKQSIIKVISSRLPQICAIQDKYKTLVLQINDQLQLQKEKCKDVFIRYQHKILECDRYKMQTVQVNQLYQAMQKQNQVLKQTKVQNSKQMSSQTEVQMQQNQMRKAQMDNGYNKEYSMNKKVVDQQIKLLKQQRQMYQKQLKKCSIIIQNYRQQQQTANERIDNLLEENRIYQQKIEEDRQTNQMLKNQITKLVIQLEENRMLAEQRANRSNQEKLKLETKSIQQKNVLQGRISQSNKTNQELTSINSSLSEKITGLQQQLSNKQQQLRKVIQKLESSQQKIKKKEEQMDKLNQHNRQLQVKVNKINVVIQNQSSLKDKFTKKLELLTKQNKELNQNNAFYKQQNQRLYQAMDKFVKKQHKLNSQLANVEDVMKRQKQYILKEREGKSKICKILINTKKQLKEIKQCLFGHGIKTIVQQFKQKFLMLRNQCQSKFNQKLQIQSLKNTQKQQFIQKLYAAQLQYKNLQQKVIQSELGANKVASSLAQSKNQLYTQLLQKDEIIKGLQMELHKQKQFNQASVNKLNQVIRKYEKFSTSNFENAGNRNIGYFSKTGGQVYEKDKMERQLENKLTQQKNRLKDLQFQYRALIGQ